MDGDGVNADAQKLTAWLVARQRTPLTAKQIRLFVFQVHLCTEIEILQPGSQFLYTAEFLHSVRMLA
jgi:hypothetical protein